MWVVGAQGNRCLLLYVHGVACCALLFPSLVTDKAVSWRKEDVHLCVDIYKSLLSAQEIPI